MLQRGGLSPAVWAAKVYPPPGGQAMENLILLKSSQPNLRAKFPALEVIRLHCH
jgi:hypothetical protein